LALGWFVNFPRDGGRGGPRAAEAPAVVARDPRVVANAARAVSGPLRSRGHPSAGGRRGTGRFHLPAGVA